MTAAADDQGLPVAVGQLVADKYRVEGLIGRGGMGCVYVATHVQILKRVALKFVAPAALYDTDTSTRFLREARSAAALSSDHVARVLDVGMLPNNTPYIVLEYLEGEDLGARLRSGPLSVDQAIDVVLQACDALGEAHRLGIVHRDVKPHNLFLASRPSGAVSVKVLDFGIAKSALPALSVESGITGTAAVMGTPQYMAPEQMASSRGVDARADVWALGVCLYQCLTARLPFEAGNALELGAMVMAGAPTPVSLRRSDVPLALASVIDRCLTKDPLRRYADANELAVALAEVRRCRVHVPAAPAGATLVSARAGNVAPDTIADALPFNDTAFVGREGAVVPAPRPREGITPATYAVIALVIGLLGVAVGAAIVGRGARVATAPPAPTTAPTPTGSEVALPPPTSAAAPPSFVPVETPPAVSLTVSAPPPASAPPVARGGGRPGPKPTATPTVATAAPTVR